MRFARSRAKWTVALVALALLAAACGTSDDTTTTGAAAAEMEFEGEVVNVFGGFVGADAAAFDATVAPFHGQDAGSENCNLWEIPSGILRSLSGAWPVTSSYGSQRVLLGETFHA